MKNEKAKRGRPPLAPRVVQIVVKLPDQLLRRVDSAACDGLCRRSEAVRILLDRALRGGGLAA